MGKHMVKNRRSELDIIAKILTLSKKGAKKTNILYKCNLSYTQIQDYLPFLIDKEVLEECLIEKMVPTYYLKQPQEKKQAFLKLLKNLNILSTNIGFIAEHPTAFLVP